MWNEWEATSDCSVTCGKGKQTSTRKILQEAKHGGKECEGDLTKSKPCENKKCKGNFKLINVSFESQNFKEKTSELMA